MGKALRKTMAMLGLAEELPQDTQETMPQPAAVTPLRRVTPVREVVSDAFNEILTVHPTAYSEAPEIAKHFKLGVPVILNLGGMRETDARRMIDFVSGLTMGLSGHFERVTNKVFLLTPAHIEVSGVEEASPHTASENGKSFFLTQED